MDNIWQLPVQISAPSQELLPLQQMLQGYVRQLIPTGLYSTNGYVFCGPGWAPVQVLPNVQDQTIQMLC